MILAGPGGLVPALVGLVAFCLGVLVWSRVRVAFLGPILGAVTFAAVVWGAWAFGLINPSF